MRVNFSNWVLAFQGPLFRLACERNSLIFFFFLARITSSWWDRSPSIVEAPVIVGDFWNAEESLVTIEPNIVQWVSIEGEMAYWWRTNNITLRHDDLLLDVVPRLYFRVIYRTLTEERYKQTERKYKRYIQTKREGRQQAEMISLRGQDPDPTYVLYLASAASASAAIKGHPHYSISD